MTLSGTFQITLIHAPNNGPRDSVINLAFSTVRSEPTARRSSGQHWAQNIDFLSTSDLVRLRDTLRTLSASITLKSSQPCHMISSSHLWFRCLTTKSSILDLNLRPFDRFGRRRLCVNNAISPCPGTQELPCGQMTSAHVRS